MNQHMGRLTRYILIIARLSGRRKYTPADELIDYLNFQMEIRGYDVGIGLRTIQRDIKDIAEIFEVEIKNRRGYGYFIAEINENSDIRYKELLMNFDLLTSVSSDSESIGYILPEHHRPKGSDNFPLLLKAIKEREAIRFLYTFYRKGNSTKKITAQPYFLKESLGLWYLIAIDVADRRLKCYGIDRIADLDFTGESFKRDESVDSGNLFRHSYGIWDDPSIPIEEIELTYSPLDGSFLKANPLHSSQEIIRDDDEEFRIRLRLRITNDFIMALLSRSKSITVIKPLSLKEQIKNIYTEALKRNL